MNGIVILGGILAAVVLFALGFMAWIVVRTLLMGRRG